MTAWFIINRSNEDRGALALGGIVLFLLVFGVCGILKLIFDHKEPPSV